MLQTSSLAVVFFDERREFFLPFTLKILIYQPRQGGT